MTLRKWRSWICFSPPEAFENQIRYPWKIGTSIESSGRTTPSPPPERLPLGRRAEDHTTFECTVIVPPSNKHPRSILDRVATFLRRPASVLDASDPPVEPQSIGLEAHIEREEGEPDVLMPQIVIDAKVFTAFDYGPIDLSEFERSLAADGRYFIWTCTCGSPGCGGRFDGVRVEHSEGTVRWHDLDTRHHFYFSLAELFSAFGAVQDAGRQLMIAQPTLDIAPDINTPYFSEIAG